MEEQLELIKAAQSGDMCARDSLVRQNTQLVWSIVSKIHNTGYDKEDLFQIGCLGLLKAINNYEINHNAKFSTYAYFLILGEIKAFIRDDGAIKISRHEKEVLAKVQKVRREYLNKNNREPRISDIAIELGIEKAEIAAALEMKSNSQLQYLYDITYESDGKEVMLIDKIEDNTDMEEDVDKKLALVQEIKDLEKDEKEVMLLRYYKDKKQQEIAILMGKTQVQISRLEKKAIEKIRQHFKGECW